MEFTEKLSRRILRSHVREAENGMTLLDYLASHFPRFDESGWLQQIQGKKVTVNGKTVPPSMELKQHDCVAFYPDESKEPEAKLFYTVVYEDEDLLVIDKPGNLCVHPTGPFFRHTLWYLVGSKYGEIHFINRLDRETSGLLVAARNIKTAAKMDNRFFSMHKEYLALVFGIFPGEIHARGWLTADNTSVVPKKKRFYQGDNPPPGSELVDTELKYEATFAPNFSLVRAIPHTGRQHQIRATLFSLGFPLVGDKLYGQDERIFLKIRDRTVSPEDLKLLRMDRQALHSALLTFTHPFSGKTIHCESQCHFSLLQN